MENYAKYIVITTTHYKELTLGHSENIILVTKLLNSVHLPGFVDNMICRTKSIVA